MKKLTIGEVALLEDVSGLTLGELQKLDDESAMRTNILIAFALVAQKRKEPRTTLADIQAMDVDTVLEVIQESAIFADDADPKAESADTNV